MPARPYRLEPFFSPPGRAGWGARENSGVRSLRSLPHCLSATAVTTAPSGSLAARGGKGHAGASRRGAAALSAYAKSWGLYHRLTVSLWLFAYAYRSARTPPAGTCSTGTAVAPRHTPGRTLFVGYRQHFRALAVRGGSRLPGHYDAVSSRRSVGYLRGPRGPAFHRHYVLVSLYGSRGHRRAHGRALCGPLLSGLPPAHPLPAGFWRLAAIIGGKNSGGHPRKSDKRLNVIAGDNNVYRFFVGENYLKRDGFPSCRRLVAARGGGAGWPLSRPPCWPGARAKAHALRPARLRARYAPRAPALFGLNKPGSRRFTAARGGGAGWPLTRPPCAPGARAKTHALRPARLRARYAPRAPALFGLNKPGF